MGGGGGVCERGRGVRTAVVWLGSPGRKERKCAMLTSGHTLYLCTRVHNSIPHDHAHTPSKASLTLCNARDWVAMAVIACTTTAITVNKHAAADKNEQQARLWIRSIMLNGRRSRPRDEATPQRSCISTVFVACVVLVCPVPASAATRSARGTHKSSSTTRKPMSVPTYIKCSEMCDYALCQRTMQTALKHQHIDTETTTTSRAELAANDAV